MPNLSFIPSCHFADNGSNVGHIDGAVLVQTAPHYQCPLRCNHSTTAWPEKAPAIIGRNITRCPGRGNVCLCPRICQNRRRHVKKFAPGGLPVRAVRTPSSPGADSEFARRELFEASGPFSGQLRLVGTRRVASELWPKCVVCFSVSTSVSASLPTGCWL